jgi:hypothetical protein
MSRSRLGDDRVLYEIRVRLNEIKPPIWRVLRVPGRTSLARLHKILQLAMGWQDSHLYIFEVDGKRYSLPSAEWEIEISDCRRMTLEKTFAGVRKSFLYEYDLGDSWMHEITLVRALEEEGPVECVAGARACPPEDCGSTPGYYELLKALSDPYHEEHHAMLEWVGGKYDPNAFDVAAVNRALKRLR